jgi:integrase
MLFLRYLTHYHVAMLLIRFILSGGTHGGTSMPLLQRELTKLKPGKHPDSGKGGVPGLFLFVKPDGRRSWVVRLVVDGKRPERGLGNLQDTPLSLAREKALEIRRRRNAGEPIARSKAAANTSLEAIYEEVVAQRREGWSNHRSEAQWRSSFQQHCRRLKGRDIGSITSIDILKVVEPIWHPKTETANRVMSRLDATIRYARAKGLYSRPEDPIDLARASLPKIKREKGHMAAVEIEEAPNVFQTILALDSPSAWALAYCILTGARSGEVRKMRATQVDLEQAVWTVPSENMKAGKIHFVPLSPLAVKLYGKGKALNREAVFPNRSGTALSDAALLECLKGVKSGITVHGWRSTFMGWATQKGYSRDLTDKALAHQEPNQVRRAYQRDELVEERRSMMNKWAIFLSEKKVK